MKTTFIDALEEKLNDPSLGITELYLLLDQSIGYFKELKLKMALEDPSLHEEALIEIVELKTILANKMREICQKSGLSFQELSQMASDPKKMTAEQWKLVQEIKGKLEQFKSPSSDKPKQRRSYV